MFRFYLLGWGESNDFANCYFKKSQNVIFPINTSVPSVFISYDLSFLFHQKYFIIEKKMGRGEIQSNIHGKRTFRKSLDG